VVERENLVGCKQSVFETRGDVLVGPHPQLC
jgi:hypothetical protein